MHLCQRLFERSTALKFYEKLQAFQRLITLNKRAVTNSIHISLNFALNEKLNQQKLIEIACAYMQKIGFGKQPYLVYEHLDAGHPHIHIVTTNIQKDGKRISIHNIGKNQSEQARKEIEIAFNLVKAEDQKKLHLYEIKPVNIPKITYGKSVTKTGIINVLDTVLPKYKYASLPELNAVLKLYNVAADRGKEDGIIFKKKGLVYRILDEKGNKIGVPIKASSIYNKPTLSYLENKFKENKISKQDYKRSLKTSIDWILIKPPKNLQDFKKALEKEKINLVVSQNPQGIVYGLTYIDHKTKCVFNGSEIGKDYSATMILARCGIGQFIPAKEKSIEPGIQKKEGVELTTGLSIHHELKQGVSKVINAVISPVEEFNYVPHELRKQKKKKRKSK